MPGLGSRFQVPELVVIRGFLRVHFGSDAGETLNPRDGFVCPGRRDTELDRTPGDIRARQRREALRFWAPIALAVGGAAGVVAGFVLAGVCGRFAVDRYGQVSCIPLLDDATGAAITLASLAALAAGFYLIFVNRQETFEHTCAECGKRYEDGSVESQYRARGRMACSAECAEKIEARGRLADLQNKIAALAAMAATVPPGAERRRARERLEEIASYAAEPVRTQAKEALRRIEGS